GRGRAPKLHTAPRPAPVLVGTASAVKAKTAEDCYFGGSNLSGASAPSPCALPTRRVWCACLRRSCESLPLLPVLAARPRRRPCLLLPYEARRPARFLTADAPVFPALHDSPARSRQLPTFPYHAVGGSPPVTPHASMHEI